jgi:hypothetical protein
MAADRYTCQGLQQRNTLLVRGQEGARSAPANSLETRIWENFTSVPPAERQGDFSTAQDARRWQLRDLRSSTGVLSGNVSRQPFTAT